METYVRKYRCGADRPCTETRNCTGGGNCPFRREVKPRWRNSLMEFNAAYWKPEVVR